MHKDPTSDHLFEAEIIRTLSDKNAQVQVVGNTLAVAVNYTPDKSACVANRPWGFVVVVGLQEKYGDEFPVGLITAYYVDPDPQRIPRWWVAPSPRR